MGSNHNKLRPENIPVILALRRYGFSCREIAALFSVGAWCIQAILARRTWKELTVGYVDVQNPVSGSRSHLSKITEDDVKNILRLHAEGVSRKELGAKYGLTKSGICRIISRNRWKHVEFATGDGA
jgi:hypothetical protein